MNTEIKEEWRSLNDYPNLFISNKGNFKRLKKVGFRPVCTKHGAARPVVNNKTLNFNIKELLGQYFEPSEIDCPLYNIIDLSIGEWKDIEGYEGYYKINIEGKIVAVDRYFIGARNAIQFKKSEEIKPWNDDGYKRVELHKGGKGKTYRVHRLLCLAFLPNPKNLPHINHINRDRGDNRIENLEWVSARENISHFKKNAVKTSKYVGVHWRPDTKCWAATITIKGKSTTKSGFIKEEDAYAYYLELLSSNGLTNKYAPPIKSNRVLWKRPYYEQQSEQYKNR